MTQQALQPAHAPTLLVVEDDPDIQGTLQLLFEMNGYQTRLAPSGTRALDLLKHDTVDLVVLDVMLPDMNGYEICEHVRHSDYAHTPVVMLSALPHQQNVTLGFEAGADDYIKKPFAPDELLLRVQRLIQRRDQLRDSEQEAAHLRTMLDIMQRQLEDVQQEATVETTLRREFLHNVTTHMRALSGIVDATLRKLPPSSEREAVQHLKSRVRGAALVYEISESLQDDPVEIGNLIRTIASALKSMYRPWRRVVLNVSGGELLVPLQIASPMAMIVNELVTNCFKHAFPDNRFGRIDVSYEQQVDQLTLSVSDDGVGFDPDQASAGRGRMTLTHLIQGIGGSETWHSSSNGTQVQIAIPLPNNAASAH